MVEGRINEVHAWAAKTPGLTVEPWTYKPRPLGEHDIEIKIDYSGICGSDINMLKDHWEITNYPIVVGHEIVGKVITVGDKVTAFKEGDIVGTGCQVHACLKSSCSPCSRDLDPHCPENMYVFNLKYLDGSFTQGGFVEAVRVEDNYVHKIPASIDPVYAPPLMCAGLTVYTPMVRKGVKKGDRVGVVGIGGLGHLAIQFAKALGAEVIAFSHSSNKREQSLELGASKFVDISSKEEADSVRRSLNHLFVTSSAESNQLNEFVSWMDFEGQIVFLAHPKEDMTFNAGMFIHTEVSITGSLIGGRKVMGEMLEFAAKHNIRPMIERFPLAKINEALEYVDSGKPRYRVVLESA
ncbi:hypothetical protein IW140_003470 [Coemansia sp. RSA 1813]|nr:hypothetical protein EV178_000871 [Coemansia sp. RSA 1646]KAJ1769599.1 hypothetical protein LPJ74_003910 [Coemansia sp. RSA 1843]KAJ2088449.1 hypothetical protein IW138_004227 [Coemansia sp. RSA 986]KAJ2213543.1 hypothetical protein EV179_003768 [Coemansia sp. RSA 487]KAJ2568964.1 hypothetical protein IW140_003470 [Coemansia sp. RSA 1813]